MLNSEVKKLPGGLIGYGLLALGITTLFVCFMRVALASGDAVELRIGSTAWVVPVWAFVAVALAFRLRQERSQLERWFAGFWLAIGVAAAAFMIVGTRVVTS